MLLAWAYTERRVLVTMDKDFGEFVFVEGCGHAGLIRLPDVPAQQRIGLMEVVLKRHARDLEERAIVTVRGGRIRISRSPV
jgi:predicted nuclease of predicted toxin-antitoxin system